MEPVARHGDVHVHLGRAGHGTCPAPQTVSPTPTAAGLQVVDGTDDAIARSRRHGRRSSVHVDRRRRCSRPSSRPRRSRRVRTRDRRRRTRRMRHPESRRVAVPTPQTTTAGPAPCRARRPTIAGNTAHGVGAVHGDRPGAEDVRRLDRRSPQHAAAQRRRLERVPATVRRAR